MSTHERALLESLGADAPATRTRAMHGAQADEAPPAVDAEVIAALRTRLLERPDEVLADAPIYLGDEPQIEDALKLLNDAEAALRTARQTAAALAANRDDEAYELPERYRFDGYDPAEIPIQPGDKRFESVADAPAWATTAAAAWVFRLATRKPALPVPQASAEYELAARDGETTVALFSDWGTGYYHSRYIARHILHLRAAQAIHLGDVYYTGTASQFGGHVTPVLEPVIRAIPMYALNANHEMDSHGIPYLAFLEHKRRLGAQAGFSPQPQETSYFCLANDRYQIVGIDTAFHGKSRYLDETLRAWLRDRLEAGRALGRITILVSQNEPYGPARGASVAARQLRDLTGDLGEWLHAGLVHAWFWGDEHYAALYASNDRVPFIGSCIGHGGYPYGRRVDDSRASDVTRPVWVETGARFPEDTGVRQDRGNNGFCMLRLASDAVHVTYWDWLLRRRFECGLVLDGARLRIVTS